MSVAVTPTDKLADIVRDQLADEHHPEDQDDCPFCVAVAALDELVVRAKGWEALTSDLMKALVMGKNYEP